MEPCPLRTDFIRDRDRILHCKSFRRMKHKTQVFLSPTGDHYRTRLTHTLEVAQIARTISRALRLNEDLTEAIALGHAQGYIRATRRPAHTYQHRDIPTTPLSGEPHKTDEAMRRYRVAIVAPSAIITEGIATILRRGGEADVVLMGEALSEIAPRLRSADIDLLIVDTALLRTAEPQEELDDIIVVGLQTSLYDGDIARRMAHAITLYAPEEEIQRIVTEAAEAPSQVSPQESHELSDRERDVLILVAKGLTNKEIASKLNISPHTVISHRKNIVHKTGIRSVAGLTVYAVLNKLIDSEQL